MLRYALGNNHKHDTMRHFADRIHTVGVQGKAKLYEEMLELIVKDPNAYRPNRTESRVRKRRPKSFPLMTFFTAS